MNNMSQTNSGLDAIRTVLQREGFGVPVTGLGENEFGIGDDSLAVRTGQILDEDTGLHVVANIQMMLAETGAKLPRLPGELRRKLAEKPGDSD